MPPVIYGLGGVHTYTHTLMDESDYKKSGAPGLKMIITKASW